LSTATSRGRSRRVRSFRVGAASRAAHGQRRGIGLWSPCSGRRDVPRVSARNIFLDCPPGEKAAAPAGFAVAGLCMADPLARLVLQDGAAPSWWHGPLRIVVAEGEADFLTWATHFSDADEEARAVIGVVAGSWTPEIAARVPDGSRVVIRTHADEAGDRYADRIAETLTGRCILQRPRRPEG